MPPHLNATLALLSLLRSDLQGVVSPACASDMTALAADQTLFSAILALNADEASMGVQAGIQCGSHSTACGNKRCCSATMDWSSHLDDLQAVAKAADANANFKKMCFVNLHSSVAVGAFQLDEDIEQAGVLPIGQHCTAADNAELLSQFADQACQASSALSGCHFGMTSPSCGGAAGHCTEYLTMNKLWPHCDAPRLHTPWSINLDVAYGPACSAATPNQCCYIPLGYDHGPSYGTPCGELCASHHRKGDDSAYCSNSRGAHYGNCFCSSVLS